MSRKGYVAIAAVSLFLSMAYAFLYDSTLPAWLLIVLFLIGFCGVLYPLLRLRPVSLFLAIPVLTAVYSLTLVYGPPVWFSQFAEVRADCDVVDSRQVKRTKSPNYTVLVIECGDRRVDYRPTEQAWWHVGKVGEKTSMAFDRTGLMKPVHPSTFASPGIGWLAVPGAAVLGLAFIGFVAVWSRKKAAAQPHREGEASNQAELEKR
ncbi:MULTISPECIES: hypothetical protein [unclassified Saccharothrix]|uniref:hypothetical protein n=1 Tax=unclassified Saccharothrix TaxID=2593673 RepID=UPI00307F6DC8